MAAHAVTLHLPSTLYQRFKRRAEQAHRSLETELLEVVADSAEGEGKLPSELSDAISGLGTLDDDELWTAARNRLSSEASSRLEALNLKQQAEGLDDREREELWRLVRRYERALLIRAQAASLLKERGHNVSKLLTPE